MLNVSSNRNLALAHMMEAEIGSSYNDLRRVYDNLRLFRDLDHNFSTILEVSKLLKNGILDLEKYYAD